MSSSWPAPLLAFSGAALFTGLGHPSAQRGGGQDRARAAPLDLAQRCRVAYYLALVGVAALAVVRRARRGRRPDGLSAPSFQPIQQAVLVWLSLEVVMAAVRWGWVLVPFGLGLAALVR